MSQPTLGGVVVQPPQDRRSLDAVSCPSPTFCEAVGTPYERMAIAETWDGHQWSYQLFKLPTAASSAELSTISCATDSNCFATGPTMGPYLEVWDGTH